MDLKTRNPWALMGGSLLILFGALALLAQVSGRFNFWSNFWPLIIVGVGMAFYAGMTAGGKSAALLAIPGSIFVGIGLLMFLQNLTNHWESWAYGCTVILISVGLGIYIMGRWSEEKSQQESGKQVMRIGAVLFIVFGAFFEMIFNSSEVAQYLFPVLLILLGVYLVVARSGFFLGNSAASE